MKKKVLKVIKYLLIVVMLIALINIGVWYQENRKVKKIVTKISEYLVIDNDEYRLKEEIKKENDETVGWIKIEGTNINYPIVQAKDNDYYLNHDYYKKKNSAGWIFMDYRNKIDDNNLIINGHHRKDKSMFGDLDKLFDKNFYNNNDGKILLVIGEENVTFDIVSVYSLDALELELDPSYMNIEELRKKSSIKFNNQYGNGDGQIIALVTCHNNNKDRLIVVGYRSL